MAIIALLALARKRREIVRALGRPDADRRALRRAISHIDAAAHMLANPPPKPIRKRVARPLLQALRDAGSLTTGQLARIVCIARGDDPRDRETLARVRKRVEDALYAFKRRGILKAVGAPLRWRLASG